ncbi:transposase family protein [Streptosporangium sandarakinum]|uniref:transposase family protein n=1 Tax=Streptosporangium sandarakinum TaxID=1260955 RepID=UPI0037A5217C
MSCLQTRAHYLVGDGMLIPTDRIRADRPYYSAKHRVHGMNIQVIASPDGTIIWTSGALPGQPMT